MKIFKTSNAIAAFSDKSEGDLSLYNLDPLELERIRKDLSKKLSREIALPIYLNQVHQDKVIQVGKGKAFPTGQTKGDGLITNLPDTPIGVFTADCCPVLMASSKAVSATHAGWKSTLQNICKKTVGKYDELYGIKPKELTAWIGPCIGSCCFEIGNEVYDAFVTKIDSCKKFFTKFNKWHLNLRELNRYQLIQAGIPENQIIDLKECTYCQDEKYFSYRRQKKRNGSMFSFIFLIRD